MIDPEPNAVARDAILGSIRSNLAASRAHDLVRAADPGSHIEIEIRPPANNGSAMPLSSSSSEISEAPASLLELFKENLQAVGGHCIVAHNEHEVISALDQIIAGLQNSPLRARRIALSDAPGLEHLTQLLAAEEISVSPATADLFDYDIGITRAQAGIAETGTLVLQSESEKHRLVSLVPPVHIAIVAATQICMTLGEALTMVKGSAATDLSPTITFITGPSRTADIELTLAIGVHGPQELHVIISS